MKNSIPLRPFYFIRHGQSTWNVLKQFAGGQVDTPLTDLGKLQAQEALETFDRLNPVPTHIIHSYLSRAKDTAIILNRNKQLPMHEEYDLREVDGGDWEGTPNDIAIENWDKGLKPDNGEDLDMFAQRIGDVFAKILNNHNYEMPFIAAHGRILNALDRYYGVETRELQAKNCEIFKFLPAQDKNRKYPWDVYRITLEDSNIKEKLTDWSQV